MQDAQQTQGSDPTVTSFTMKRTDGTVLTITPGDFLAVVAKRGGHRGQIAGDLGVTTQVLATKIGWLKVNGIDSTYFKRLRGLAAADPETRRAVAAKGGAAVARNKEHMARIGKKGGESVSKDRAHMASIGAKGGAAVSQNTEHMATIGKKGGSARWPGESPTS